MRTFSALLLALVLAGCGNGNDEPEAGTQASGPETTMSDACPAAEAVAPKGIEAAPEKYQALVDELDTLIATGDLETQNALKPFRQATQKLINSEDFGVYNTDEQQAYADALVRMAERCEAAGSSAFQ